MNKTVVMVQIEEDIVQKAKDHVEKEYDLKLVQRNAESLVGNELILTINKHKIVFDALIKTEVRNIHIDKIIEYNSLYEHFILVVKHLYPNIKKQLRKQGVNYLEANGNFYINTLENLVFIDTNAPLEEKREAGNRAFTKTGLQVLYQLLKEPSIINAPQREIAKRAGVALGNIPKVIEGLIKSGYLLKYDKNTFEYTKKEDLLIKWATDYENTLRPTLEMGRYKLMNNTPWKELSLNPNNTYWGAEPAADLITNYLRAEVLTIYTHLSRKELMQQYKLIPASNGNIQLLKAFWPENTEPALNN
ncbi:MAG: type IV toxin-antitoxin system AbiEi family antitoxin, partial [Bacteroidia bacterium]